jgi:hypothetical protein
MGRLGERAAVVCAIVLFCSGMATAAVVQQPNWRGFYAATVVADLPPPRSLERTWIEYGKRFADVSKPGARIAVCPAGAIIYFSHRGGVDLLGKIEPYVAHLPAALTRPVGAYCWRDAPGHNKEDVAGVFRLRDPEFSRYPPPPGFEERYYQLRSGDDTFYVRNDIRPAVRDRPGPR